MSGLGLYVLTDEGVPWQCPDVSVWARWYETADRCVGETVHGQVRVSTVFLGIDHAFDDGAPLLYETMIFGGEHDGHQDRCGDVHSAVKMHNAACKLAFGDTP